MTNLMKKVGLSLNVAECITQDLNWFGVDYLRKVYRIMCNVNTYNSDIKLKIDRKDCELLVDNSSLPKFICSIDFINSIGLTLVSLKFSEYDAMNFVDHMNFFLDQNHIKVYNIEIESIDDPGFIYSINLFKLKENIIKMTINKSNINNPMNLIHKVTVYLDNDNIQELFYSMYFSWFIDLDTNDIELMEAICDRSLFY